MKSPQEVRTMQQLGQRAEFVKYCRSLMLAGESGLPGALEAAIGMRAADNVVGCLKEAVAAGTTQPGSWSRPLVYEPMAQAWLSTSSFASFTDRILQGAMLLPTYQPYTVVSGGGIGSVVGEGMATPMMQFQLDIGSGLEEFDVDALVAVSKDLLKVGGQHADRVLDAELQRALRRAQDTAVLARIVPTGSPDPSIGATGTTPAGAWADLRNLIEELSLDAQSHVVLGVSPTRAKRMAFWASTTGERAFPNMTPMGGEIAGAAVTVSDRIADDEVIAVDPTGLAGNAGLVIPEVTTHANLQLETTPAEPTGASTVMISLWQRGLRGLRLQRRLAIKPVRYGAVAKLAGVAWNNPA